MSDGSSGGVSLVRLRRTMCYGYCPVYRVELRSDGSATYDGEYYVDKLGRHTGRVDPGTFERLVRRIEALGFFALKANYTSGWTDMSTCITTVVRDGRKKRVSNDEGAGPKELTMIEKRIDYVVDRIEWSPGPNAKDVL